MSESAKTLMYWVTNSNSNVADNESDKEYCLECARKWPNSIFSNDGNSK